MEAVLWVLLIFGGLIWFITHEPEKETKVYFIIIKGGDFDGEKQRERDDGGSQAGEREP